MLEQNVNVVDEMKQAFVSNLEEDVIRSVKRKRIQEEVVLRPILSHLPSLQGKERNKNQNAEVRPAIPDMEKAADDYNSVDYKIMEFNLHRSNLMPWDVVDKF